MLRNITAVIVGIVIAFATIWIVDSLGHLLYPLPSDLNVRDPEQVADLLRTMPAGALAFVAAAWLLGALVGGLAAASVARARWAAWAIAALVAVAAILNIYMIPHPEWLQIAAVIAPALGGLIAGHLYARRPAVAPEADVGI